MAHSYDSRRSDAWDWRSPQRGASATDDMPVRDRLHRLEWLANLLDTALVIPGTGIRFGADAVLGLAPGIGDAITTGVALWIVYEARQLGAPSHLIARMAGNVMLDGIVGAVPIFGDVFDVMWRANRRNVALLREHLARQGRM
jgi:hypothetical protein